VYAGRGVAERDGCLPAECTPATDVAQRSPVTDQTIAGKAASSSPSSAKFAPERLRWSI
jgi:hypothetical protein